MKILPICLALIGCALAAEPVQLPLAIGTLKLRDGSVYEEAKVVGQDAVGLKIMHAGGTARLPYVKLPKELADRFPRDAKAAKEQLDKEAKEANAHERSVDKAVSKQKAEEEADDAELPFWEKEPDIEGNPLVKIAPLNAYIGRLENGIEKAREDAARNRERAIDARAKSTIHVTRTDSSGQIYSETRTSQAKLRRAETLERRARDLDRRCRDAEKLIELTQQRIKELEEEL